MMNEKFENYRLEDPLLRSLRLLHYEKPTEVQKQVIPAVLDKKDVIVKSQTGSGKTAAFAIPICQLIEWDDNKPQALVLTPTRELAIQVREDVFNVGRFKRLKVAAVFGKSPFYDQEKELKQKTHVVVGTPGRTIDHIERGTFDTSNIKYLVVDEADKMLQMGFIEQIETILDRLPGDRVTMLLSATLPKDIIELCEKYMNHPLQVEVEEHNPAVDRILQERYQVEHGEKINLLRDIIIMENPDSCIIFCNTKQMVDEVFEELEGLRYLCEKIHGGMEQRDRLRVMDDFRKGRFRYLVATDVAARGIDIDNISLVINYDVPQDRENYVHRIGRTGRIGNAGRAITFVAKNENRYLQDIQLFIAKEIPIRERPDKETVNESKQGFLEKIAARPEIKESKGARLSKDIMKLHINAGRKTKMRPVDVVGTLCNIEGMTAEDIGIINVMDISTFVEILNNKGDMVLRKLQKTPIKGRLRTVTKVDNEKLAKRYQPRRGRYD
jgi:superfamily II DNA/RNA helicase